MVKARGNEVVAVGNTKNIDLLYQLGADLVIDYKKEDFTTVAKGPFRVILDAVGKSSFGKCKHLLEPNGAYISSELGPGNENLWLPLKTKLFNKKRVLFPIPKDCKKSIQIMKDIIEAGQYMAVIDKKYPMEESAEAYTYVETGEKTANVILTF